MGLPGPQSVVFRRRVGLPDPAGLARRLLSASGHPTTSIGRSCRSCCGGAYIRSSTSRATGLIWSLFYWLMFRGAPSLAPLPAGGGRPMGGYRAGAVVRLARHRRRKPDVGVPDRFRFIAAVRPVVHGSGGSPPAGPGTALDELVGPGHNGGGAGLGRADVLHRRAGDHAGLRRGAVVAPWLVADRPHPSRPARRLCHLVRPGRPRRLQEHRGHLQRVGRLEGPPSS